MTRNEKEEFDPEKYCPYCGNKGMIIRLLRRDAHGIGIREWICIRIGCELGEVLFTVRG